MADELKDPPRPQGYDQKWPLPRQPWRPFDEHGHQKIGRPWGDLTWRSAALTLLFVLGIFVVWLLAGSPR